MCLRECVDFDRQWLTPNVVHGHGDGECGQLSAAEQSAGICSAFLPIYTAVQQRQPGHTGRHRASALKSTALVCIIFFIKTFFFCFFLKGLRHWRQHCHVFSDWNSVSIWPLKGIHSLVFLGKIFIKPRLKLGTYNNAWCRLSWRDVSAYDQGEPCVLYFLLLVWLVWLSFGRFQNSKTVTCNRPGFSPGKSDVSVPQSETVRPKILK